MEYFEENRLIDASHHGFRSGHNTTTALIEMIDNWVAAFDRGDLSADIALDMSAAFDLVDKKILLDKLSAYKVDRTTIRWVKSYLSNRNQCVYVDGALSEELPVNVGVP